METIEDYVKLAEEHGYQVTEVRYDAFQKRYIAYCFHRIPGEPSFDSIVTQRARSPWTSKFGNTMTEAVKNAVTYLIKYPEGDRPYLGEDRKHRRPSLKIGQSAEDLTKFLFGAEK